MNIMIKEVYQEEDVLMCALEAFTRETGVPIPCEKTHISLNNHEVDALLHLPDVRRIFPVEIKRWAKNVNIGVLIQRVRQLPERGLLVADYVNPPMARKLKEAGVQLSMEKDAPISMSDISIYML